MIAWTDSNGDPVRLRVWYPPEAGGGYRDASPADVVAALQAMDESDRLRVLAELPEYADRDPVVQGLRLQRLQAQDVLVPVLEARIGVLESDLAKANARLAEAGDRARKWGEERRQLEAQVKRLLGRRT